MCVVAYGHGLIGDHKLGNHKSRLDDNCCHTCPAIVYNATAVDLRKCTSAKGEGRQPQTRKEHS